MTTPIILIVGAAGSGKDTAAKMIVDNFHGVSLAFADPMKRFAMSDFGFSEETLWGASELRNVPDDRFASLKYVSKVRDAIRGGPGWMWINDILPNASDGHLDRAHKALIEWGDALLLQAHHDGSLTPRKLLQTLGTKFGRSQSRDIWVNYAFDRVRQLMGGGFSYYRTTGTTASSFVHGYNYAVVTDGRFRNELYAVKTLGGKIFKIQPPVEDDASAIQTAGVKNHASEMEQKTVPDSWFDAVILNDKSLGLEALEETVSEAMAFAFESSNNVFVPVEHLIQAASNVVQQTTQDS